jgi:amino acid transporter
MLKKIKQLTGILAVLFLIVILFIAILTIWDVINIEIAKDALTKIAYTFGAILLVSLVVIYITKTKE